MPALPSTKILHPSRLLVACLMFMSIFGFEVASVPRAGADTRSNVVAIATGEIGQQDNGAPGCNKYSTADGRGCEAWCADFVSWVWRTAGVSNAPNYGYTPTWQQ